MRYADALAFAVQTLCVFAGNSRLFGLLSPGSGWYTNVEMSVRYASLVTPAKYAFAIWGVIYTWETAAMIYLFTGPSAWGVVQSQLWIAANVFQALWAPLFAMERLTLSALSLSGIAVCLVCLGLSLREATGVPVALLSAPVWLHAGWTTAASLVNLNLVLAAAGSSAPLQLSAAFASVHVALAIGVAVLYASWTSEALGSTLGSTLAPLPYALALGWALWAVRAELRTPDLIKGASAYHEIGEAGRAALEMACKASVVALAVGSAAMAGVHFVTGSLAWTRLCASSLL